MEIESQPVFRAFLRCLTFTLSAVFLLIAIPSFAQQEIEVFGANSLKPITKVAVFNSDGTISDLSDESGKVQLPQIAPNDTLTFQHPSYYIEKYRYKDLQKASFKVYMIDKIIFLDETVVSVSKTEERARNISNTVDVLHPTEIAFKNPQTSADMLENTGHVFIQKSQMGGGSPIIRGFEANKVLIVVDGVRMNNAIYRGGHLQNVITIDNAMIERTEVVYGPGSLIYGSDALGGVMHFMTKLPKLAYDKVPNTSVNAFTRFASVNLEKTAHCDISLGGKKFGSLSSFTFSDFDDLKAGKKHNPFYPDFGKRSHFVTTVDGQDYLAKNTDPHIQRFTGYRQYDVLQKFLYRPNENLDVILNIQYSTTSDIPRFDKLNEAGTYEIDQTSEIFLYADTTIIVDTAMAFEGLKYAEWYYGPQDRLLSSLQLKLNKVTKIYDSGSITAAYQKIREQRFSRKFRDVQLTARTEDVHVMSLNVDFFKPFKNRNSFQYGLESTFNQVNSTAYSENVHTGEIGEASTRYPGGGSNLHTYAGYIKYSLSVSDKAVLTPGIRMSQIFLNSKFLDSGSYDFEFEEINLSTSAFSGSFGIAINPGRNWHVNLLASSGFRAPNVDDIGKVFDPSPAAVVVPNEQLKPEYTYNLEAGISKVFNESVKFEVAVYNVILREAILRNEFTFNNTDSLVYDGTLSRVYANTNSGKAVIRGFTATMMADITPRFSMESHFNYTIGKDITNDVPMPHIPPIYGHTELNYQNKKFRAAVILRYSGWKHLEDYSPTGSDNLEEATAQGTPAWYVLNLKAGYQIHKNFGIQAGVNNLLDHHYRPFASGVSGAGRDWFVTLRTSM